MAKFIRYCSTFGYGVEEIEEKFSGRKNVFIINEMKIEDDVAVELIGLSSKLKDNVVMKKFGGMVKKKKIAEFKKYNKNGNIVIFISTSILYPSGRDIGSFSSVLTDKYAKDHAGFSPRGKKIAAEVLMREKNMPRWKFNFITGSEFDLYGITISQMKKEQKMKMSGLKKMKYKILLIEKVLSEIEKILSSN